MSPTLPQTDVYPQDPESQMRRRTTQLQQMYQIRDEMRRIRPPPEEHRTGALSDKTKSPTATQEHDLPNARP